MHRRYKEDSMDKQDNVTWQEMGRGAALGDTFEVFTSL